MVNDELVFVSQVLGLTVDSLVRFVCCLNLLFELLPLDISLLVTEVLRHSEDTIGVGQLEALVLRILARVVHQSEDFKHLRWWVLNFLSHGVKAFLFEIHLLGFEDGGDIELMQLLVDIVDTELFEVVVIEVFETENIQKTNSLGNLGKAGVLHCLWLDCSIHLDDEPVEQVVVELLGERVSVTVAHGPTLGDPKLFTTHDVELIEHDFHESCWF